MRGDKQDIPAGYGVKAAPSIRGEIIDAASIFQASGAHEASSVT
jgi:hypothetical protein